MRRYTVLLFITGTVWAKTDFDKFVLKDGTEYFGKYLRMQWGMVYFKTQKMVSLDFGKRKNNKKSNL